MRPEIAEILGNLGVQAGEVKDASISVLRALIEEYNWPGRYDSIHRTFMPESLQNLTLTKLERVEIIESLQFTLNGDKLPFRKKASLIQILGLTRDIGAFKTIVQVVAANASKLDSETAYLSLLGLTPTSFFGKRRALAIRIWEQTGMDKTLEMFALSSDKRLADLSQRMLDSIKRMKSQQIKRKK